MGLSNALSLVMLQFRPSSPRFPETASDVGQYGAAYKIIGFLSTLIVLYGRNLLPPRSRAAGTGRRPCGARPPSPKSTRPGLRASGGRGGNIPGSALDGRDLRLEFSGGGRWPSFSGSFPRRPAGHSIGVPCLAARNAKRQPRNRRGRGRGEPGAELALIPRYSFRGSAVASLVSEMLLLGLMVAVVSRRLTPLPLWRHVWKPLLACAPMAVFLFLFPSWSILLRVGEDSSSISAPPLPWESSRPGRSARSSAAPQINSVRPRPPPPRESSVTIKALRDYPVLPRNFPDGFANIIHLVPDLPSGGDQSAGLIEELPIARPGRSRHCRDRERPETGCPALGSTFRLRRGDNGSRR